MLLWHSGLVLHQRERWSASTRVPRRIVQWLAPLRSSPAEGERRQTLPSLMGVARENSASSSGHMRQSFAGISRSMPLPALQSSPRSFATNSWVNLRCATQGMDGNRMWDIRPPYTLPRLMHSV